MVAAPTTASMPMKAAWVGIAAATVSAMPKSPAPITTFRTRSRGSLAATVTPMIAPTAPAEL